MREVTWRIYRTADDWQASGGEHPSLPVTDGLDLAVTGSIRVWRPQFLVRVCQSLKLRGTGRDHLAEIDAGRKLIQVGSQDQRLAGLDPLRKPTGQSPAVRL